MRRGALKWLFAGLVAFTGSLLGTGCGGGGGGGGATCGNGALEGGEVCDDGNVVANDGCSPACGLEAGWSCTSPAGGRSTCVAVCGDGRVLGSEACDDGNVLADDGCSATCALEPGWNCSTPIGGKTTCTVVCGDGRVLGGESCDDGNVAAGDGCSPSCGLEPGWSCTAPAGGRSTCTAVCGDGMVLGDQACDDGTTNPSDGCSSTCSLEPGWNCTTPIGGKTTCASICGDGILVCSEVCDDGNFSSGDGCSPGCLVETGWECHGVPSACSLLPARVRTPPSLAAPITGLPDREWSHVGFPNTTCGDGSPDGLFISRGNQDVLFLLVGGSTCSTYFGCSSLLIQGWLGPLDSGVTRFNSADYFQGTIFSREDVNNVFKDFTFILVPFCTGDSHGGDAVVTYSFDTESLTVHHKGHANLVAFLERVAATWPNPGRLVVGGYSNGGFGTLLNYDTFRLYWPNQKMYLVDDSGPFLSGFLNPYGGPDSWTTWNVDAVIGDVCPACMGDPSAMYATLQRWYPNDRKSLLSTLYDENMAYAYRLTPADFGAQLRHTSVTALEPSRWSWYFTPATDHTLLLVATWGGPAMSTVQAAGVPLQDYLRAQIDDEPSWCPVTPPP